MKAILLMLLLGLIGCNSKYVEVKEFTLKVRTDEYSFNILKDADGQMFLESSFSKQNTLMPLSLSNETEKILEGKNDVQGKRWVPSKKNFMEITEVSVIPFYSYFGYQVMSKMNKYENGLFSPNCTYETEYVVIFYHNEKSLPIIGCAVSKK